MSRHSWKRGQRQRLCQLSLGITTQIKKSVADMTTLFALTAATLEMGVHLPSKTIVKPQNFSSTKKDLWVQSESEPNGYMLIHLNAPLLLKFG